MPTITLEDLLSTARCVTLYHELWGRGVLGRHSEAAQEQFFALVAYALRYGAPPPKLLAYLLARQSWDRITPRDTRAAQVRLHAYLAGQEAIEQHRRQAVAKALGWQAELTQRVEQARSAATRAGGGSDDRESDTVAHHNPPRHPSP
jgi:hypothetical protein